MFKNRRRVIINSVVFVLALTIYLGVHSHYSAYLNVGNVANKLERSINDEIEEAQGFIERSEWDDYDHLMTFASKKPYRDFFMLKGDSVVYYTSNKLIISDPYAFQEQKDGFCLAKTPNRFILFNRIKQKSDTSLIHVISLKNTYAITNRFLVNNWIIDRDIPRQIVLGQSDNATEVRLASGFGFYIDKEGDPKLSRGQSRVVFIYFLIAFTLMLILLFVLYDEIKLFERKPLLKLPALIFDVSLVIFVLVHFKIPGLVFESYLFEKSLFLFPSAVYGLGQAVIYSVAAFVVAMAFYQWKRDVFFRKESLNILLLLLVVFATIGSLFISYMTVKNLVFNAEFTIKISQPVKLSPESVYGVGVLSLTLISAWIFATSFIFFLAKYKQSNLIKYLIFGAGALVLVLLSIAINWLYFFLFLQYLVIGLFAFHPKLKINVYYILVLLLVSAIGYSVIIEKMYYEKDKDIVELRAIQILNNRDKILEARIGDRIDKIQQDSLLRAVISEGTMDYSKVESILSEKYLSFLKQNYETTLTFCDTNTRLLVDFEEETTDCFSYFKGLVSDMGLETITTGMYYIDDGDAVRNYIVFIPVRGGHYIFIDIYEKNNPFTQGYPELLEVESQKQKLAGQYDYAIYWDNEIVSSFGDHSYPLVFNRNALSKDKTFENHVFREGKKVLVITQEKNHLTNALAGTSYLFIAFGIVFLVFYMLIEQKFSRDYLNRFRNRLQASIFSILLLTFVVIGYFMFNHIVHQNTEKNVANLKQLSHSILIELEHKFSQFDHIDEAGQQYTFSQLVKFSKVFFSDINLYNPSGKLVASSRLQVFERNIISERIHKEAFVKLRNENLRMFIMREKIGNYEFLSSYFPLRNYNNEIIAYANLPYFARQKQLTEEIADFLTTFINIYVVLTIVSLFLIWVTSNYITKPMETIKKSLRQTKLSKSNIKIQMKRKDEIGELVQEYNNMVDEIERSARKLAVSERESAWREMAKQVAHEIKNPLTPMKLSVQHLNRVIKTDDEQSKLAMKRFTTNMIDQIESLSEIASAFSDFAKMPVIKLSKVDLYKAASNTISLFDGLPDIDIELNGEKTYIKGDEKQLRRVLINLLKNSVQALEGVKHGKIIVDIQKEDGQVKVFVKDNGKGIPENKKDKIFLPDFTTKSSGTGLGLAMVKNIMTNFGGTIALVESSERGTVFLLSFPECKETSEQNE